MNKYLLVYYYINNNMNHQIQISEYVKNYLLKHGQLEAQMVDQPTLPIGTNYVLGL